MKLKLFHYLMGVIVALLWLPMRGYGQSPPTDLNFYVNHTTSSNSSDGYIEVSVAPEGNNELVPYDFILQTNLGTVIRIQEEVTFPSGSNRTVTFENLSQGIYCVEVTKYANDCTEIAGKCDLEIEACANPSACLSPNFFVEYDGCEVQFLDASAGDISSWDWNFGDGNFESGAYLSAPVHEYYSAGSYLVTMTITDENGVQNSISKTVSVSCGNGDGNPDCSINAPSFVSLGQTFLISGEAFDGVGPYTYEWELPFELNHFQLFGPGPHHITISENSFLHNGDNITIFLRVYDAFGNYSSCSRDITISGQIPEIDLLVFPNLDGEPFPPDSYMCFVVFADTWNLSLDACYQFNVVKIIDTDGNTEAVGGFPSNCQYSWDYCDATFTTGHYQVCVDVRDGPAVYQDCEIFVVGEPGNLPNPEPSIMIQSYDMEEGWLSEPFGLEACEIEGLRVESKANANNLMPYIDYTVTFFAIESTGLSAQDMIDLISNPDNTSADEIISFSSNLIEEIGNVASHVPGDIDGRAFEVGKVYDLIARACKNESNCEYIAWYPAMLTIIGSEIEVEPIVVGTENCNPTLNTEANCGTPFVDGSYQYEWSIYHHINEEVFIEDIFEDVFVIDENDEEDEGEWVNSSTMLTAVIDYEHPYFLQFEGEQAHFYAEVIVTDADGHQTQRKEYVSIPLPLRTHLEDEIFRCPSENVSLVTGEAVIGGTGNYNYSWVLDGSMVSSVSHPIISYQGREVDIYTLIVDDGLCSASKDIVVNWSDLELDFGDNGTYACNLNYELSLGPYHDDLGGSGQYEYEWVVVYPPTNESFPASEYLDNPFSLNPNVIKYYTGGTLQYTLTIRDILSDCEVAGSIFVSPSDEDDLVAIASDEGDLEICHGDAFTLGSNQNGDGATVPVITWTANHPLFGESDEPVLILSEAFGELAGNYTFKVRVEDVDTRCAATDEVNVKVRKPWVYQGFQSNLVSLTPPVDLQFAWNEGSTNKIYTETETPASGAVGDFSYQWLPNNPDDDNDQVSSSGYLRQSKFNPLLQNDYTIKVTDNGTGCSKDFRTNRYLVFEEEKPMGEIILATLEEGECETLASCFDVSVHVPYLGNSSLPNNLTVGIEVIATNIGGGLIIEKEIRLLHLDLIDQNQSTYKGRFCFTAEDMSEDGVYEARLVFSNGFLNGVDINSWYPGNYVNPLYLDEQRIEYAVSDRLVPQLVCAPEEMNESLTLKGIQVQAAGPFVFQCAGTSIVKNGTHQVEFIGGASPEGHVLLRRGFHAENGSNFHAYINPCLQLDENLTEENDETEKGNLVDFFPEKVVQQDEKPISSLHTLNLFPNPFNTYLTIDYQIETLEIAQVTLNLLDISGKKRHTLIDNEQRQNGQYQLEYNTADLPAGVYFYELIVNNSKITKKAVKVNP